MQISFTGHHIEVTNALKTFTEEKLSKLERHYDGIQSVHVVFSIEKLQQVVEATVQIQKAKLHARSESENMYASIDLLLDKLDRQLVNLKEKRQTLRESGGIPEDVEEGER